MVSILRWLAAEDCFGIGHDVGYYIASRNNTR